MTLCRAAELRVRSKSAHQTQEVAGRIHPLLVPGDVILLGGDLGAGKTTFTQGLARAMGVVEPVTSPTFTLIRSYDADAPASLLHADVYRLEHLQEVVDLGLPELLDQGAVAVIEWGEVAAPLLMPDYLAIRFDFEDDGARSLAFSAAGARWSARMPALRRVLTGVGAMIILGWRRRRPRWAAPWVATRGCWRRSTSARGVATPRPWLRPSSSSAGRPSRPGRSQRVAVDVGPGLFTGLRVGVATAKALAAALRIPMVGLSSLDLLAYPHRRSGRLIAAWSTRDGARCSGPSTARSRRAFNA